MYVAPTKYPFSFFLYFFVLHPLSTGTPVQNNMRELFGILNFVDPDLFSDEAAFLKSYGDERASGGITPAQVQSLQEALRPLLLRRMKEDVETLPEKEEVVIWVELTVEQRAYYKALYERQIGALMAGASIKNMPNMRNLAMELRKLCCHPVSTLLRMALFLSFSRSMVCDLSFHLVQLGVLTLK
jgi:SNF2 family DNA or RNA helicase